MSCISLPGIVRIAYISCTDLPENGAMMACVGAPAVVQASQLTDISIEGEPTCEADTDFDNNSTLQKVKLKFQTLDHISVNIPHAFVIVSANGQQYIIGTRERPYPIVKVNTKTGLPSGDPSVMIYEVSLSAKVALSPCSIST